MRAADSYREVESARSNARAGNARDAELLERYWTAPHHDTSS
jgi:hypothetical protein